MRLVKFYGKMRRMKGTASVLSQFHVMFGFNFNGQGELDSMEYLRELMNF